MLKNCNTYGFTLLEVLIGLVILAIGLLGIAQMLMLSHRASNSNYVRQQAIQAASDIIDRIRANRTPAINGNYNVNNLVSRGTPTIPSAPSVQCAASTCTAPQLATYDTWYWLGTNLTKLPNGCGSINTAPAGRSTLVTVKVQWDDSLAQQSFGNSTPNPEQLIVNTLL